MGKIACIKDYAFFRRMKNKYNMIRIKQSNTDIQKQLLIDNLNLLKEAFISIGDVNLSRRLTVEVWLQLYHVSDSCSWEISDGLVPSLLQKYFDSLLDSDKKSKESFIKFVSPILQEIQEDEKTRFLVANPTTGGFGLTLTACNTVIYFSNNYNLEVRMQSEDRAHRLGQKGTVVYIDIVARGTLDEAIMKSLTSKGQIAAKTLGEEDLKGWLL